MPVQPHYIARPIFDGVDDPVSRQAGVLPGYDAVAVPDLPDPERPRPAFAPIGIGNGHRHGGAEAYANACLRRLALAPEGRRHATCVAVSCRLLALAKAGLLDPVRVAGQIKGVMVGKGFDGGPAATSARSTHPRVGLADRRARRAPPWQMTTKAIPTGAPTPESCGFPARQPDDHQT